MKQKTCQEFIPIAQILENGEVKLKDKSYIKIIKIEPINFNLKSKLEKQAILNSFKNFFKKCNFDFQIFIMSKKENLNLLNSKINNQIEKEHQNEIKEIEKKYQKYINNLILQETSRKKEYYVIIKTKKLQKEDAIKELEEKCKKIKEGLESCGNKTIELKNKNGIEKFFTILIRNYYG